YLLDFAGNESVTALSVLEEEQARRVLDAGEAASPLSTATLPVPHQPRGTTRIAPLGALRPGLQPCVLTSEITNSIGMKLALIPAGKFLMGSPKSEEGRYADEGPQHEVVITRPFYIGVYEVTQEEYLTVMRTNPSWFSEEGGGKDKVKDLDTRRFPVEQVSWE